MKAVAEVSALGTSSGGDMVWFWAFGWWLGGGVLVSCG